MDCPRKIKLPNELLSEFILCLPFNFGYPTIRVSAVFDFFLAKKQQNFRKRNEEAIIRQLEIASKLSRDSNNASEMVSVLLSEIKKSANIPSSRQSEALLQQQLICNDLFSSLFKAQKHIHQLFKFALFVRAASKSVAWGTPKRRLGTDDNGTSPKKAKSDGTEQTELADTAATEPLAKEDGTELAEKLEGAEEKEPLMKEDGVAMENLEGTSKTVTEPMEENPADTGMTEKPPLVRKGSFKIVDLIKEEPKQQKKL